MPAAFYFSPAGQNLLSTNPVNFLLDSPLGVRASPNSPPPGPNDHIYLRATTSGNANMIVPLGQTTVPPLPDGTLTTPPPPNTYAGIHLIDSYVGTVELEKSVAIGAIEMKSPGSIWQHDTTSPLYAGTLWVTSSLDWTAGTLNSGTVGGTVALAATAVGTAEPSAAANYTVTLGSTLRLLGTSEGVGSTLNMLGGTFNVVRGSIIAGAFSTLFLIAQKQQASDPKATLKIDGVNNNKAEVIVDPKSEAVATTTRQPGEVETLSDIKVTGNKGGKFTNHGTTKINNLTELIIQSSQQDENGSFTQDKKAATDPDPVTRLEAGSQITCGAPDVGLCNVQAGKLEVVNRVVGYSTTHVQAEITAKWLAIEDGATLLMPGTIFTILKVNGKFLYAGVVQLSIGSTVDQSDKIVVTKDIEITKTTAKLLLPWDNPNTNQLTLLQGQRHFLLMESTTGEIKSVLDPARIDPAFPVSPQDVSVTADKKQMRCDPYILLV